MNTTKKKAIGLITLATSCLAFATLAAENGLVAHFTFDDATQFGYDSVQKKVIGEITNDGYDATKIAAPTSCEAPIVRGLKTAQGWGASNYMTVPGTSFGSAQGIPYGDQAFTWSLWICPATTWAAGTGLGTAGIYLLRHAVNGHEWYDAEDHLCFWLVKGENNYPKYTVSVGGSASAKAAVYQHTAALDGKWHFLAATYSNRVLTLFFDGQQVARTELANGLYIPDNTPLILSTAIGNNYDLMSQRRYVGSFDDIKVYNRALESDEVLAAYQAGATAYDTDVLEWDGAAAGGAVEDVGNWSTKSNRRTAGEVYAAGNVAFDVTALEEGGMLTHDTAATLNLKGVVCSNGQNEVTLQMKQGTLSLKRPSTQRGLVAHLSFDDPGDMLRDSGTAELAATSGWWMDSSRTGEAVPNQSVEGVSGKALYFPGNGQWGYWPSPYVRTSPATTTKEHGIPKGGETVTYSLWIKPYAQGRWDNGMLGLANNGPIWIFRRGDWGNGGATYLWLQKGSNDGRLCWSINNYMGADGTCTYDPTNLFDGNWHHVVCVYDAKVLTLYYDGAKVATTEASYALNLTDGRAIFLGRSNEGTDANENYRRYLGGFDEFKVFNVALTEAEVAAEYAQFSKTLDTASVGTVPSPVKLQLDAGTAAEVRGYGHEYGSLFGLGSLSVGPASLLKLDGTFGLSGALTGCGPVTVANLVLGGDADEYTGDFTIAENAKITVSDANGTMLSSTFGGKVVLPKKATIAWGVRPDAGEATLTAATLVPPTDFAEWVDSTGKGVRVKVVGNQLKIKIRTGLVLVVR